MTNSLCIIPARGGSKRIPRKNIKNFLGRPIISYSIKAAIESKLFKEVMVSTDDEEIASIAKSYGAKVPFLRSKKNANDFATTTDVLLEVINKYKKLNSEFEYCCCVYPSAPFVNSEKLVSAYKKLTTNKKDVILPIMPFSYPIQRALRVRKDKVEFIKPKYENSRSQDTEEVYHDAGQFYFFDTKQFILNRKIITDNTGFIKISELEGQDIDNEDDWRLAELKYGLL